jgi:hypothetical protein
LSNEKAGEATTAAGFPTEERRAKVEARHRVAIEPWGSKVRRLDIPWGMIGFFTAIVLGIGGPGVWSVWEIGVNLGWWS